MNIKLWAVSQNSCTGSAIYFDLILFLIMWYLYAHSMPCLHLNLSLWNKDLGLSDVAHNVDIIVINET